MSNHKDSLVKVLEYLVNEEREKASDLLHDIFVEKAKNHWAALSESDESVEEDIQEEDLDETYDVNEEEVEEAIDSYDAEEDFLDDIESAEEEIDQEEIYDDEDMDADDAEMDIAMDMDPEAEEGEEAPEAEEAMANVEDAIAELRAAFADMMGDEAEEDEEAEEEPEMEESFAFESDDDDEEEEVEGLDEGMELKKVSANMANGEDASNKSAPVGPGDKSLGEGTPVDIAGSEEKGPSAPAVKDMGVNGPQDAGSPKPAPKPKREMK